ncbi:myo-inositol-1(or 4)-monophosphatase, putative [gamma proteobacterium HTCC5015]|nr:myo-inositol-1(or 4)-monophosphatase, putative [gamma proteobacterium HTCC5015]
MAQSEFLKVAIEAATAAEAVIRRYYLSNLEIEVKEDRSPVTVADVETEKTIKSIILEAFPDHGFYGEETGKTNADAEYLWLIDPIDGTKSFVRQYPMFSTQIALMHKGELIVGVSNSPMFQEMCWAERGAGAFMNGEKIAVSDIDELQDAALSTGNIATLAGSSSWAGLGELIRGVSRIRGYGDFFHYHLLASGKIDLIIESDVNILDIAALSVIIEEAGGRFTDLEGKALDLDTTSVLASNNATLYDIASNTLRYRESS